MRTLLASRGTKGSLRRVRLFVSMIVMAGVLDERTAGIRQCAGK
jgi:hypothetical protein